MPEGSPDYGKKVNIMVEWDYTWTCRVWNGYRVYLDSLDNWVVYKPDGCDSGTPLGHFKTLQEATEAVEFYETFTRTAYQPD